MLFDLQGRRKNAVKVVYAILAVLMGGGLVLFGVGGQVSGGLIDAFTGGGSSGGGNDQIEESIDKREEQLKSQPNNEAALRALVRDYYQLASTKIPEGAAQFPPEARGDLQQASIYWLRYAKVVGDKVNLSLAGLAGQLYGPEALNQPKDAQEVYRVIAERNDDVNSYAQLISAATIAGDERTVGLATIKALDLAPKGQRKEVQKQIKEIKRQAQALAAQAGGGS